MHCINIIGSEILTLGWFWAVSANCGAEFQNKIFIRMFLGTYLIDAYFTVFFSHAHSGLQNYGKQKTVKSHQIRSKATLCRHSPMVGTNFFSLPPGTSGQVGLIEITNKMNIPQNHQLTNINSTKNQCSYKSIDFLSCTSYIGLGYLRIL